MKENNTSGLNQTEIARLTKVREEYRSGQRSEYPTTSRLEFARRIRGRLLVEELDVMDLTKDSPATKAAKAHLEQAKLGMPLREQAEDIRARVYARARGDSHAARSIIKDRANGQLVTRLGMRMEAQGKSKKETINVGIVAGTGSGEEDGTVSISYLLIKRDNQSGHPVENQLIKVKILRGGEFSIRKDVGYFGEHQKSAGYSVIYPRPDRPEFGGETIVADDGRAKGLLQETGFVMDRCLTQPNLSFYRQKDLRHRALLK